MQRVQVFQIKHRDISRQDWVTFCYFPCTALQPSYWRDTRQPVWSVWSENQDIKGWWESHTRTQLTCAPHRSLTPIICCWVFFCLFTVYCSLFSQLSGCKPRQFVSLHFRESHVKWSWYTYSTGTPLTRRVMLDLPSWSHLRRYSGFLAAHMLQHQCTELLRGRTGSRGHARLNSWRWNMCCGISFMMWVLRSEGKFN